MKPSPAHRLGYLAGASVLATVLVFALSGPSIVRADAAPPPVPGTFGPAMRFVLSLSHELKRLEMTVAGFAESFTTNELTFTRGTGNQLTVQTLCIGSTCITETQLQELLAGAGGSNAAPDVAEATASTTDATDTPPIIQINGDNPAIIAVGDTYTDLGATITGPQTDSTSASRLI